MRAAIRIRARPRRACLLLGLCLTVLGAAAQAASVLMISVDGLKPEYVLEADARGLKIPYLRSLLRDGAYARGVTGVVPTVTYPSHTTLITGVWPAEHGIFNNLEFDPRRTFGDSWYWYATQIRAPTLWQAAHRAGLSTASIGWPVSVAAVDIDTLVPEFWRINRPSADLAPSDRHMIAALSRPEGLLAEFEARLGPYIAGNDASPPGDVVKTRFAHEILRVRKPKFMTVHLSALDEEQHAHGPFSAEAKAELEVLDAALAELVGAARANDPDSIAVVVSDHGFVPVTTRVNLYPALLQAKLLDFSIDPVTHGAQVNDWKATLWTSGGMGAVMLNPAAGAVEDEVRALLAKLKADDRNGIAAVLDHAALKARGGFPDARFLILMQPGFYLSADPSSDRIVALPGTPGGHGFSPEYPEMRAAFFAAGSGIVPHKDLGVIDMRQIAPTVAKMLKVPLPTARAAPLPVFAAP